MKLYIKYLIIFVTFYGVLLGMIYGSKDDKRIKMPVYNEKALEARTFDIKNIFNINRMGQLLTSGFRLDFIQVSFDQEENEYATAVPSNEVWESRSQSFIDIFEMIQIVKSYPQSDKLVKGNLILEYLNVYTALGQKDLVPQNLNVSELNYMGSFDIYLIDLDLSYQKLMVCSLFESEKSNYRALVTYDFDERYHIIFDESRNTVVNYLYQKNKTSMTPMGFSKSRRLEEKIYGSILEMMVLDINRLQITYNADQLLVLRQVKELR